MKPFTYRLILKLYRSEPFQPLSITIVVCSLGQKLLQEIAKTWVISRASGLSALKEKSKFLLPWSSCCPSQQVYQYGPNPVETPLLTIMTWWQCGQRLKIHQAWFVCRELALMVGQSSCWSGSQSQFSQSSSSCKKKQKQNKNKTNRVTFSTF